MHEWRRFSSWLDPLEPCRVATDHLPLPSEKDAVVPRAKKRRKIRESGGIVVEVSYSIWLSLSLSEGCHLKCVYEEADGWRKRRRSQVNRRLPNGNPISANPANPADITERT